MLPPQDGPSPSSTVEENCAAGPSTDVPLPAPLVLQDYFTLFTCPVRSKIEPSDDNSLQNESLLIRLRWRLPLILFVTSVCFFMSSIAYYGVVLDSLAAEMNSGGRVAFVVMSLIIQTICFLGFLLSGYVVSRASAGKVPAAPWRLQPWFLNRETFQGTRYPLNCIEDITRYHNDLNEPTMAAVRALPVPRRVMPIPVLSVEGSSSTAEIPVQKVNEGGAWPIPDNYSPFYDKWRNEHLLTQRSPSQTTSTNQKNGSASDECWSESVFPVLSPLSSTNPEQQRLGEAAAGRVVPALPTLQLYPQSTRTHSATPLPFSSRAPSLSNSASHSESVLESFVVVKSLDGPVYASATPRGPSNMLPLTSDPRSVFVSQQWSRVHELPPVSPSPSAQRSPRPYLLAEEIGPSPATPHPLVASSSGGTIAGPQSAPGERCDFSTAHHYQINPFYVSMKEPEGDYRYCFTCHLFKPDVAYHCKVCRECVYNFDHHCPYVDACIGRNNYRCFISFLVHSALCMTLSSFFIILCLVAIDPRSGSKRWLWFLLVIPSLLTAVLLIRFLIKHLRLIYQGRTTMEKIIWKRRVATAKKKGKPPPLLHPYYDLTPAQKKAKREAHQRMLFGPPRWNRWLAVLNPFPYRNDEAVSPEPPIILTSRSEASLKVAQAEPEPIRDRR